MRLVIFFVLLVLSGLAFQEFAPSEGPEDDPVHGTYVRPLKTQMLNAHRKEWRAALDKAYAEDGDLSWNSENQRRHDWVTASWPFATPEIEAKAKAWNDVYNEWHAEHDNVDYR